VLVCKKGQLISRGWIGGGKAQKWPHSLSAPQRSGAGVTDDTRWKGPRSKVS